MIEYEVLWKQVLEVVRVSVSSATFSAWFGQTFIINIGGVGGKRQTVEIGCPSPYVRDTLQNRYFGLIQDALSQITGKNNDLVYVVKPNPNTQRTIKETPPLFQKNQDDEIRLTRTGLPKGFTFENFAVSTTNQLAHAAAQAVAKNPASSYNPLIIWGGVGVGKTHLSVATARQILDIYPDKKVLYCTSEEFLVEIVEAIRTKTTNQFKKRYRGVDVLVIDDIQFIAGRPTAQEEFFHTFNAILKAGGQVIITGDRPPQEIPNLADRLRSRFEAGLIVDIAPPDFELRAAILLIKAGERGINLSRDCVNLIAGQIISARGLEGFLVKLQSRSALSNNSITLALVEKLLGQGLGGDGAKKISTQDVLSTVCSYFSISKKSLLSPSRIKTVVLPRQILMYLLRVELKLPLEEIGRVLGGRDHTTIIHGVGKINSLIKENQEMGGQILGIKKQIWG